MGLKQQRNRITNALKQQKLFLTTKEMITEAGEITKAKNNTQAALALKKSSKRTKEKEKGKIGKHFKNHLLHRSGSRRDSKRADKLF